MLKAFNWNSTRIRPTQKLYADIKDKSNKADKDRIVHSWQWGAQQFHWRRRFSWDNIQKTSPAAATLLWDYNISTCTLNAAIRLETLRWDLIWGFPFLFHPLFVDLTFIFYDRPLCIVSIGPHCEAGTSLPQHHSLYWQSWPQRRCKCSVSSDWRKWARPLVLDKQHVHHLQRSQERPGIPGFFSGEQAP